MLDGFKSRQTPGKRGDHSQFYEILRADSRKKKTPEQRAYRSKIGGVYWPPWGKVGAPGTTHYVGFGSPLQFSHPELRIPDPRGGCSSPPHAVYSTFLTFFTLN